MLEWVNQWKRSMMGWVGLAAIASGLLIGGIDPNLRYIGIVLGTALVILAMPKRVWTQWRTWWQD
tara:strand:+ start:235 stop:429 length:195 start_codon:yes stop_codon:yes gene_type:complete